MAIYTLIAQYALLEGRALGPEEVERMIIAYEKALSALALKNGDVQQIASSPRKSSK